MRRLGALLTDGGSTGDQGVRTIENGTTRALASWLIEMSLAKELREGQHAKDCGAGVAANFLPGARVSRAATRRTYTDYCLTDRSEIDALALLPPSACSRSGAGKRRWQKMQHVYYHR